MQIWITWLILELKDSSFTCNLMPNLIRRKNILRVRPHDFSFNSPLFQGVKEEEGREQEDTPQWLRFLRAGAPLGLAKIVSQCHKKVSESNNMLVFWCLLPYTCYQVHATCYFHMLFVTLFFNLIHFILYLVPVACFLIIFTWYLLPYTCYLILIT